MNKVIKNTIFENKHILILASITSILFIIGIYFENMYQSMFQGYHTIYYHYYWLSHVNFYSTMSVTMFSLGVGFCFSLFLFLTHDVVMPMVKGD